MIRTNLRIVLLIVRIVMKEDPMSLKSKKADREDYYDHDLFRI